MYTRPPISKANKNGQKGSLILGKILWQSVEVQQFDWLRY